ARRRLPTHGTKAWNTKKGAFERQQMRSNISVCLHLGERIRKELLPLLIWVRDEAIANPEAYPDTPTSQRKPVGTAGSEAEAMQMRQRVRTRKWCAFAFAATQSPLAKKFGSTPIPRERKSTKMNKPRPEDFTHRIERIPG